ncbi:MAG: FIST C-terminal domain-containing protein [Desulfovibrionaceae bacterium]|nr:FIST C-terminal domain-containing protein [Desulfovibrionaceae bacterium]
MDMLNAYTYEVDSAEQAVAELKRQLDLERKLKRHSAAFITCSYDFVESGIIGPICEALPFDVVGCTTLANGVNAESGSMQLCLSVLTADDCAFSTGLTAPLERSSSEAPEAAKGDAATAAVCAAWQQAAKALDSPPVLSLAFFPMLPGISGDLLLSALDQASGSTPVFGATACDYDTATYANSFVIHNGQCYRDRLPFLLISGNVHPRYIVASTTGEACRDAADRITSSQGSTVKTVNGNTAEVYLESIGLTKGAGLEGLSCVPFLVDYRDGTQPIARAIYALTEEGYAVFGGAMPEGGGIRVSAISPAQITATTESAMRQVLSYPDLNGLILFPCLGYNMIMVLNPGAKLDLIRQFAGPDLPWHLAYSSGEICPLYEESGGLVNRFHNFTFIACAF